MAYFETILQALSLTMLALALIFTLGIIWRVELKLDTAYKVFFVALVFLFASKIMDMFIEIKVLSFISQISNFLFSIFLLSGIWMMRNLFRNIDGEKE